MVSKGCCSPAANEVCVCVFAAAKINERLCVCTRVYCMSVYKKGQLNYLDAGLVMTHSDE